MKFLADMGIAPQTAAWLRRLGHDAVHLSEQGLERMADAAILEKARLINLDLKDKLNHTFKKFPPGYPGGSVAIANEWKPRKTQRQTFG